MWIALALFACKGGGTEAVYWVDTNADGESVAETDAKYEHLCGDDEVLGKEGLQTACLSTGTAAAYLEACPKGWDERGSVEGQSVCVASEGGPVAYLHSDLDLNPLTESDCPAKSEFLGLDANGQIACQLQEGSSAFSMSLVGVNDAGPTLGDCPKGTTELGHDHLTWKVCQGDTGEAVWLDADGSPSCPKGGDVLEWWVDDLTQEIGLVRCWYPGATAQLNMSEWWNGALWKTDADSQPEGFTKLGAYGARTVFVRLPEE